MKENEATVNDYIITTVERLLDDADMAERLDVMYGHKCNDLSSLADYIRKGIYKNYDYSKLVADYKKQLATITEPKYIKKAKHLYGECSDRALFNITSTLTRRIEFLENLMASKTEENGN